MEKWGFIYTSGDGDGHPVHGEAGSQACVLLSVGVPSTEVDPDVVEHLIAEGVELIELCGAFGPGEASAVIEMVDGRVPVGFVTYPASEAGGLQALFG
jgi:hypothetical protein